MVKPKLNVKLGNIKYIIHIADIHIRNYKRHTEYKAVFANLYKACKEVVSQGNTLVCIAGDIVHAKTDMSPELIEMTSKFFTKIADIAPTVVITGNHDCNLNNSNRLDALTPIISNLKHPHLYYLKDSGLYQFGDVLFGVQSVYDGKKNWPKIPAKVEPDVKKIALFHGPLSAAKTDVGYVIQGDEYTTKQFDGYDLAMLGDIHRMQYLNSSKTVAYPGSLIQQNHGESLDHGFMLWDMGDRSSKFVKVENDYGFFTIDISGESISDYSQIPKKARLRLRVADSDPTFVREFITSLKRKVKVEEINIINKSTLGLAQMQGNKVNFGDLRDVNVQNLFIKDWLDKNSDIDNETMQEVFKINNEQNKNVPIEEKSRNVIWTPKKFEFSNMFSYGGDNVIDFTKMHGIYGMFAANAQGKSGAIDAMLFNLFNKSSRANQASRIININSKNFYCKFNFEMNGSDFFIEKIAKRYKSGHVGTKANFWEESAAGIKDHNGTDKWGTDEVIASYIGDFEDFVLTSLSVQGKNSTFIDKSHTEKKDIFIRFLEMSIFDKLFELANESFKSLSYILKEYEKKSFDDDLLTATAKFKKEQKEYNKLNSQKETLQYKKKTVTEKLVLLSQKIVRIDTVIRDLDDLRKQKENILISIPKAKLEKDKLKATLDKIDSEIKQKNQIIENVGDLTESWKLYQDKEKEYNEMYSEIEKIKIVIGNKLEKLKTLDKVEYDPKCTYCMNNIFVKDAIATKQEVLNDKITVTEKVKHCSHLKTWLSQNKIIKTNKELIDKTQKVIEEAEKLKAKITIAYTAASQNVDSLNSKLKTTEDEINNYYQNKKDIEHNKKIQERIEEIKKLQDDVDELLQKAESEILTVYSEMKVARTTIDSIQSELKRLGEYEKQYRAYEHYLKAIQRDGIPYDLITKVIPILEQEVNSILSQIVEFTILFELDDSKNINVKLSYDEHKIWPLELASGMEKFIAGLAIRVALCKISSLPRPNILIVDEGWDTLDSDNLNSVGMLFEYLKTQYEVIIVISHIDSMRDMVDGLIEIKKDGEFSKVEHTN
ncbi:MAG: metallophosphoesterase [Candidatus Paceibacterota bacterium]|jgi:DNA repair exonuclease SbcCD ATPase subunit